MSPNTGRTVGKNFKFQLEDIGGVMRDLPVNTISGVGITHEWVDVSALQDALKGWLAGHGDVPLEIGGPLSTDPAVAASASGARPALSGSYTILVPLNGKTVPLMFAVYIGIRHDWETGDPVFGIVSPSAEDGVAVGSFVPDVSNMTYTASLRLVPGSKAPTWGTAAIVVA
ncbi:MAG: hypothetical protein KF821_09015 [Anaerolineales bacterium]|nr:hypothetical protein [Anaerolineales bacterium]